MDWNALAAQKYSILQQQADTASAAQRAQAGLQQAQASSLGMLSPAQAAEMRARAGLAGAQSGLVGMQTEAAGITNQRLGEALDLDNELKRQTATNNAMGMTGSGGTPIGAFAAGAIDSRTPGWNPATMGKPVKLSGGMPPASDQTPLTPNALQSFYGGGSFDTNTGMFRAPALYSSGFFNNDQRAKASTPTGFKKGTAKVPGKGDGTKDTVPAKLAPGEAVLNKAAAEHMGRGLIGALNQMGAEKMGLVPVKAEGSTQNFAAGTEDVQPLDDMRGSTLDEYTKRLHFADPAKRATSLENDIADIINNARVRGPGEKSQAKYPR